MSYIQHMTVTRDKDGRGMMTFIEMYNQYQCTLISIIKEVFPVICF